MSYPLLHPILYHFCANLIGKIYWKKSLQLVEITKEPFSTPDGT